MDTVAYTWNSYTREKQRQRRQQQHDDFKPSYLSTEFQSALN